MGNWLKDRLKEPSTYNGVSLLILGAGVLGRLDHTEQASEIVKGVGEAISTGDYVGATAFVLSSVLGIILSEKGKRK